MRDRNETAALVRRLGGAAAVANMLDISRQAVHRWVENDRIGENYVTEMLALCLADRLPVLQAQIRARQESMADECGIKK